MKTSDLLILGMAGLAVYFIAKKLPATSAAHKVTSADGPVPVQSLTLSWQEIEKAYRDMMQAQTDGTSPQAALIQDNPMMANLL